MKGYFASSFKQPHQDPCCYDKPVQIIENPSSPTKYSIWVDTKESSITSIQATSPLPIYPPTIRKLVPSSISPSVQQITSPSFSSLLSPSLPPAISINSFPTASPFRRNAHDSVQKTNIQYNNSPLHDRTKVFEESNKDVNLNSTPSIGRQPKTPETFSSTTRHYLTPRHLSMSPSSPTVPASSNLSPLFRQQPTPGIPESTMWQNLSNWISKPKQR